MDSKQVRRAHKTVKTPLPLEPTNLTPETLTFFVQDGGFAQGNETAEVKKLSIEALAPGTAFLGSLALSLIHI